jgi:hypothetical protein
LDRAIFLSLVRGDYDGPLSIFYPNLRNTHLGILGVIGALESSGNLASFERPIVPLLLMAVIAVALLIAAHVLWLNSGVTRTPQRVR